MYRNITLILLLLVSFGAAANSYWLLGSYPDRDSALAEAKRISAEAGMGVLILSSGKRHRLMASIMSDENDRADMRLRLKKAGIDNIFVMNYGDHTPKMEAVFAIKKSPGDAGNIAEADMMFDDDEDLLDAELSDEELAEIDAMLDDDDDMGDEGLSGPAVNYVVAGSFQDEMTAETFSMGINAGDYGVSVRSAIVGGAEYYRVLVGPVSESDEVMVMRRLAEQGHDGVWVLRGVKSPWSSQSLEIGTPPKGFRVPSRPGDASRRMAAPRQPGEDSDFNLAKLKKK